MGVCKICQRRPSPAGNMIVYCDSCDRAYHQYCHHPPIDREEAAQKNRRWLCAGCRKIQGMSNEGLDGLVTAGDLTIDEVCDSRGGVYCSYADSHRFRDKPISLLSLE